MKAIDLVVNSDSTFVGKLARHFTTPSTEDGKATFFSDAFVPIFGALVGSNPSGALGDTMKILSQLPSDSPAFLEFKLREILETLHVDPELVVVNSTYATQDLRNFSQSLEKENRYRIDLWLPSSAACGYVVLSLAHLITHLAGKDSSKEMHHRLQHYSDILKMLATAAGDGGSVVFQNYPIEPSLQNSRILALELLNSSIGFILYHELGHILRGHIRDRNAAKLSPHVLREQEFEADEFALKCLLQQCRGSQDDVIFGILAVFIAVSLMTVGPDDAALPEHPSLVARHKRMIEAYDKIFKAPRGHFVNRFNTILTNTFANVFDRDRCPAWLGVDRRTAMGLPPDHEFRFSQLDFNSMGRHTASDLSRAPAKTRNISLV